MKILAVIPARYASTRFPGKPLVAIGGRTMIRRVYEQVQKASGISGLIVATDDERIANEVRSFNGNVMLTSSGHLNGTERCAEVLKRFAAGDQADVILNIQGDEPFIQPEQINLLAALFEKEETEIGTLVKPCSDKALLQNPSIVKTVLDNQNRALYFSRSVIPFVRDAAPSNFYKHIGLYGFRKNILEEVVALPPSSLEKAESLEQLRWLENGYSIQTAITNLESISIDTPEDLLRINF